MEYKFYLNDHGTTKYLIREFGFQWDIYRFMRKINALTRWEVSAIYCNTGRIY